jgi:hypothetical protein
LVAGLEARIVETEAALGASTRDLERSSEEGNLAEIRRLAEECGKMQAQLDSLLSEWEARILSTPGRSQRPR